MKKLFATLLVLGYVFAFGVIAETAFAGDPAPSDAPIDTGSYFKGLKDCTPGSGKVWDDKAGTCVCPSGQVFVVGSGNEPSTCQDGLTYCQGSTQNGVKGGYDASTHSCYYSADDNTAQGTVLPDTFLNEAQCEELFRIDASSAGKFKKFLSGTEANLQVNLTIKGTDGSNPPTQVSKTTILGCGIKTGRIHLWMIPYYIKSLIQFALGLAGLIAVGAMVVGGYFYLFGAMIDDKEKGKRAIMYGIGGFVVALLAWAIVNIIISIATM